MIQISSASSHSTDASTSLRFVTFSNATRSVRFPSIQLCRSSSISARRSGDIYMPFQMACAITLTWILLFSIIRSTQRTQSNTPSPVNIRPPSFTNRSLLIINALRFWILNSSLSKFGIRGTILFSSSCVLPTRRCGHLCCTKPFLSCGFSRYKYSSPSAISLSHHAGMS